MNTGKLKRERMPRRRMTGSVSTARELATTHVTVRSREPVQEEEEEEDDDNAGEIVGLSKDIFF